MDKNKQKIEGYWKAVGGCVAIQDPKTLGRCYFALKALYKKQELPEIEFPEPEDMVIEPLDPEEIGRIL